MQPELFDSSDSQRTAQPLKYAQRVKLDGPLELEQGDRLAEVEVVFETYGQLSPARDNAILVCHALSGDSHVARHDASDTPGWWDILVGPQKPIDTDRYFVICPNILGGCRGTTGPNSIDPETGRPYGADFPVITVGDMVEVQRRLVDHLGIERLLAVVGGSLGGHMVLTWATHHPQRVAGAVALATSPRLTSQALAFDVVGRNAIIRDPAYAGGQYYEQGTGPTVGLALARMLGHITYLSHEAMTRKFDPRRLQPREVASQFETKFSVGSYLAYQGDRFVERFDANSYLTLSMALDLFDLGDTPAALAQSLAPAQCRWLLVSFTSDWLFPPFQSQQLVDALIACRQPVSYANVRSNCGHDAFLLSDDLDRYGEMVREFLTHLHNGAGNGDEDDDPAPEPAVPDQHAPTSIFRNRRLDYDSIVELIEPGASVLDLGCGTGGLLARLKHRGHHQIMGIEQDERAIVACIRRGLDVVQADLNAGLPAFADRQFDYVVLSQTLQAVMNVDGVLSDVLRVGRWGIVSFPNFAYRKMREQLAQEGRAPRAGSWLGHNWYDTPNVRFLSIADFEDYCRQKGICIHTQIALDTAQGCEVHENPNLNADVAVMVISR
jgi:homoserine O-acetyltransferase